MQPRSRKPSPSRSSGHCKSLDNLRQISSTSSDGAASISVAFDHGVDVEQSLDRTVREINALRPQLPAGITRLESRRPRTTEAAISQIALTSETASWRRMEKYAEDLRDRLGVLRGVRNTQLYGLPAPEVRIALDFARLAERKAGTRAGGQCGGARRC